METRPRLTLPQVSRLIYRLGAGSRSRARARAHATNSATRPIPQDTQCIHVQYRGPTSLLRRWRRRGGGEEREQKKINEPSDGVLERRHPGGNLVAEERRRTGVVYVLTFAEISVISER